MPVSNEKIKEALSVFENHGGIMRTSEALEEGVHSRTLYWMRDHGYLDKLERGVYKISATESLSNPDLVIVGKKIRAATICLISALHFHDMTTQLPHKIHIALSRTRRNPKLDHPPIKVHRFSGNSLTEGIEIHEIDGIEIQVYNPAKTIADCFKFRNKIGLDVAIEALKDGVRENKASFNEIDKFAKICRVQNVIRPYAETIAHS